MNFLKKSKSNIAYLFLSFLLPSLILALVLFSKNIFWQGETTILASDGFHQYVIFAQNLRNILHGTDSIFYTFTSGLGINFYALSSYYLGSVFSPFVYFFDLASMPDAIYLFSLIKIGLIGLSTCFSLSKLYPKVIKTLVLVLSTSFALMSFSISQIEINMWLDVFILIPLIVLGLNRLLNKKNFLLYYFSLTLLFVQNYYFGYMTAIFLTLYFLVQLTEQIKWKIILRKFIDFTLVSIMAGLTSSIMLLPTYLDLSTHGESFTSFTDWLTDNSWYLDIFAKNFVGSYDTTKFGAIPMIYVGLLPLILALIFFTLKAIKWQLRLAYAFMLILIIASFYLEPLDLLWQGMHAPNMFLHRYAWVFSFLIILLAAESLTHLNDITLKRILFSTGGLGLAFLSTAILKNHYDFLDYNQIFITFAFLLAYTILLFSFKQRYLTPFVFISFTLLFTLFETSLNTYYQILALDSEWVFPSRQGYEKNLTDIDKLVKYSQKENNTFYRTERLLNQTGNDSMKYNYRGISQFSSIRNTASSSALDRLGFKSTGTNLNLRYQNNTILMDSLFAIMYNLSENTVNKYGFDLINSSGTTYLYKNQNAAQLAILTNGIYKNLDFSVNTLDNQTNFINRLTGLSEKYFTRPSSEMTAGGSLLNNRVTVNKSDNQLSTSVNYQVMITSDSQLYISMPNIIFSNDNSEKVQITVNDRTTEYTTDNAYSFFDIGYFNASQTVNVTITFPENTQVSFDKPNFYALNLESYQKAMNILTSQNVSVKTESNTVRASYETDKETSLLFTIPYDKGWTASLDGEKIELLKAQDGFMKVDLKAGSGTVILTFIPNGLKEGAMLSLFGLASFISYSYFRKRKFKIQ